MSSQWVNIAPGRWALRVGGGAQPLAWVEGGSTYLWHAGHWLGRRKRGSWWPYAHGRAETLEQAIEQATSAVDARRASGNPVHP